MTPRELLVWQGTARWYEYVLYLYSKGYIGINSRNSFITKKFEDISIETLSNWVTGTVIARNFSKVPSMIARMIKIKQKIEEIDREEFYRIYHDTST